MSIHLKTFFRFCIIVLLQVLVLNRITAAPPGMLPFTPYLYPLFILLLPFETPVAVQLVLGFVIGIVVDSFMNTAGMHACATVLIAYLRTNIFHAMLPRTLEEYPNQSPGVKNMGWGPFLIYSGILIFIHHFVFFTLEFWNLASVGQLLLKILTSGLTTMLFVVAYLLLFTRQQALQR
jgi:hypothetical protein